MMEVETPDAPVLTRAVFQRERATPELIAELTPLLVRHYLEIAHFQDIELNPDYSLYLKMEEAGAIRIFTARRSAVLVGYAIYFVRHNPHYRTSLQATQDILFVDPDHRGITGARLILFSDDALATEGVQVVMQHVKVKHDFGPMLGRIGYELVEKIYVRRLN